ncbi:MAG: PilZ domain-containing protein [Gammaproteobacteria bacterium]
MDHRMSLRIPIDLSVTVKPLVGRAFSGELQDVSFDGAFLATATKRAMHLVRKHVRIRLNAMHVIGHSSPEIRALVVRAEDHGIGLAFDSYDEAVNEYLERAYAERLRRELAPLSWWY